MQIGTALTLSMVATIAAMIYLYMRLIYPFPSLFLWWNIFDQIM